MGSARAGLLHFMCAQGSCRSICRADLWSPRPLFHGFYGLRSPSILMRRHHNVRLAKEPRLKVSGSPEKSVIFATKDSLQLFPRQDFVPSVPLITQRSRLGAHVAVKLGRPA